MSKVEKLEKEVQNLTSSEFASFRDWFLEYAAQAWDQEIENDLRSGKLDDLADEALAAHRAGKSKEF